MNQQKGFAHILLLILLIAGLAFAVFLVGQKTNLFSKASRDNGVQSLVFSKALHFDNASRNSSYATVDAVPPLLNTPFTVEGWIKVPKPISGNGSRDYSVISLLKTQTIYDFGYIFRLSMETQEANGASRPTVQVLTNRGSTINSNYISVAANNSVAADTWNHIAATFESGNNLCHLKLFVNGRLANSSDQYAPNCGMWVYGSPLSQRPTPEVFIARPPSSFDSQGPGSYYFNGDIDEIRFSNSIRYTGDFTSPLRPFITDGNTYVLNHLDDSLEGSVHNYGRVQLYGAVNYVNSAISQPVSNHIRWSTSTASLEAENFYIESNGQTFLADVSQIGINSDPGDGNRGTLEATWRENGVEMRTFIYFSVQNGNWNVDEIRTYDGREVNGAPPGNWEYYHPTISGASMGSTYTAPNLDLVSDRSESNLVGKIHFENLRIRFGSTPAPSPIITIPLPEPIGPIEIPNPFDPTPHTPTVPTIPYKAPTSCAELPGKCANSAGVAHDGASCTSYDSRFDGECRKAYPGVYEYCYGSCTGGSPTSGTTPNNPPVSNGPTQCPSSTARDECIGYTANGINAYCWKADNSYLGGAFLDKCKPKEEPANTPAGPTTSACADVCYSTELQVNVGKVNGVCNAGVSSTSYFCQSQTDKGKTQNCGGRSFTCNGSYWQ